VRDSVILPENTVNSNELYQKYGWELIRELIILGERSDESSQVLREYYAFRSVMEEPPPYPNPELDHRFRDLAKQTLRVARVSGNEFLFQLAAKTIDKWETSRFEADVISHQKERGCSAQAAQAYQTGLEFHCPDQKGSLFALRCILGLWNCNGERILREQSFDSDELDDKLAHFPEFEERISFQVYSDEARAFAESLRHEVWGTDHLLLSVAKGDCHAATLLRKLEFDAERGKSVLMSYDREPQDFSWAADNKRYQGSVRFLFSRVPLRPRHELADGLSKGHSGGLPRKRGFRGTDSGPLHYEEAGELLMRNLRGLVQGSGPMSKLRDSAVYRAIFMKKRGAPVWAQVDYERRFLVVARQAREIALRAFDPKMYSRSVIKTSTDEVFLAWGFHKKKAFHFSGTMGEIADNSDFASLSRVRRILANQDCQASRALAEQGVAVSKLAKALRSIPIKAEDWDVVVELNMEAEKLALELSNKNDPTISTIHFIIALLEFTEELEVKELLEKLGVNSQQLRVFAFESVDEP
jgi:ClpA/ClpB-like protein